MPEKAYKEKLRGIGGETIICFPLRLQEHEKEEKNEHKFTPNASQKERPVQAGIIPAAQGPWQVLNSALTVEPPRGSSRLTTDGALWTTHVCILISGGEICVCRVPMLFATGFFVFLLFNLKPQEMRS